MPDITPVVVILDGQPVSSINPLPTSGGGGGGGGIVEQGKQGSIASPWFVQPTADGATVSLPLPTGAATAAKHRQREPSDNRNDTSRRDTENTGRHSRI